MEGSRNKISSLIYLSIDTEMRHVRSLQTWHAWTREYLNWDYAVESERSFTSEFLKMRILENDPQEINAASIIKLIKTCIRSSTHRPFGGTTFHLFSIGWCCLVHSYLGWRCFCDPVFLSLLLEGLSSIISSRRSCFIPSSEGWCCLFFFSSLGSVACHLLCRGAVFLPFLGGWCCFLLPVFCWVLLGLLLPLGDVAF